jgi:hypothetical protein
VVAGLVLALEKDDLAVRRQEGGRRRAGDPASDDCDIRLDHLATRTTAEVLGERRETISLKLDATSPR